MALRLPFYVSHKYKIDLPPRKECLKIISISKDATRFSIRFGNGGSIDVIPNNYGLIHFLAGSSVVFGCDVQFAAGCSLRVDGGTFRIGNHFSANRNCEISCTDGIEIGNNVLCAFRVGIRDSDGHTVVNKGTPQITHERIVIGDHVWICGDVDILKGVCIGTDSVVAFRSLVLKGKYESHTVLGGIPAKALKTNMDWKL